MTPPSVDPARLLIVLPNWVGDVVMASPALAALRTRFATAQITFLMRPYVSEVVAGCGWHDDELHWPAGRGLQREWDTLSLATKIRRRAFDAALLLTNSFRSAAVLAAARVARRIGYARDGRTLLLTERLQPHKQHGRFVPSPVTDAYCRLAEHLGAPVHDRRLRLGISPQQEQAGQALKTAHGLNDGQPYAVINPGAKFGAAKCWLPERFAEVCDELVNRGQRPVLVGGPDELPLLRSIAAQARRGALLCEDPATSLGSLKVLIRDAALLVCNDTGPRSYGKAFDRPTVTIFGPTHQAWTDTAGGREIKLQVQVPCGPCQLRTCPLDHRCMTAVTTDMVMRQVERLAS